MIIGLILILGIFVAIAYFCYVKFAKENNMELGNKFASLGDMTGMAYSEVIKIAGSPAERKSMAAEHGVFSECIWRSDREEVSAIFDENDKFVSSHRTMLE